MVWMRLHDAAGQRRDRTDRYLRTREPGGVDGGHRRSAAPGAHGPRGGRAHVSARAHQLPLRGGGQAVRGDAPSVRTVDKRFEDMHEISLVCDALGIDPWELIGLANRHPGVGGHCIAVDPWFIVHSTAASRAGSPSRANVSPTVFREGPYRGKKRESTYTSSAQAARRNSGSTRQSNPQCRKASAPTSRERSSESSSDERRR